MKIKEVLSSTRRDFTAVYECEHCEATKEGYGYEDWFFHETVIPGMKCEECGKTSPSTYVPDKPRYEEGQEG